MVAAIGVVIASVSSCASAGTAVAQPRFGHVPASCAVALTPVAAEIDQFAGSLRADDDRISTDADPGLDGESIGVRCVGIYSGDPDTPTPLQDTATGPTSRHLFLRFIVIPGSDTVSDPVAHTRQLFEQRRPPGASDVPGVGEAAYAVTTHSRYPSGIAGTVTGSVEISFRTSNLIVAADIGGINIHDSSEPAQLLADLKRDADAITRALAADIDTAMA
ncbi:hypothetical protein ACIO52_02925 [Nocardia sp. NPDC087230]|uniref:hypothetical protein n=1 Tax=Nocardia sp. NPDC087230 TaxID=3364331 RepID=UPI003811F648